MVLAFTIDESSFAPAKFSSFGPLFNIILPLITAGAAMACLAIMLHAAYKILTGGDNPETIQKSIKSILYAGFGLAFVVASFVIVKLLGRILGVDNFLMQ